jgi:large subunit ribosomal protein LP0
MVKLDRKEWKKVYFTKLKELFNTFSKCLVVGVDHVQSKQMQNIRIKVRNQAELCMGKNTMIRKCIREMMEERPELEELLPYIKGNIGFAFTDMDLTTCRDMLLEERVQSAAKAGVVAPVDVVIPAGPTGMDAGKTSFFQALNLPTKIARGTIEILSDVVVCKKGDKVGLFEARLLNMLNISPFFYGLELEAIFDNGAVYPPEVLNITAADIRSKMMSITANRVAALSLAISLPNAASVAHMIMNGFKNALALAAVTDITFKEAEKVKAYLENPEAFAVAAAPAAASGGDSGAAAKAPEPEPEEEEDDDMEMSLFD